MGRIHLFENDRKGNFTSKIIWGSTNHDFASSGMTVADLNQDGIPDIVFANGDDLASKAWSSTYFALQWLKNTGDGNFNYNQSAILLEPTARY